MWLGRKTSGNGGSLRKTNKSPYEQKGPGLVLKAKVQFRKALDDSKLYRFWQIIHIELLQKKRDRTDTFKKIIKEHHGLLRTSPIYSNPR